MDTLNAYLSEAPVSIGLIRAIECRKLRQENLTGQVLDVGCGDGLFSSVLFRDVENVELYGIDTNEYEARRALNRGIYRQVLVAKAQKIPFQDGYFDVILSNSVLEHIHEPHQIAHELHRLLKPGGKIIITVPSIYLEHYFFYTIVLRKLGLANLGQRYSDFKNRFWRHYNLWPLEKWVEFLAHAGFKLVKAEYILSKQVTIIADILLPFAVPSVLVKKRLHRLLLLPNAIKARMQSFFLHRYEDEKLDEGAGIVIMAERT